MGNVPTIDVCWCNVALYLTGIFEVIENVIRNVIGNIISGKFLAPEEKLLGRTALVTGSSRGVGKGLCKRLVQHGCNVILACRDTRAALKVVEEVERGVLPDGCVRGRCKIVELDLASLASVRQCCRQLEVEGTDCIDFIICNAGIMAPKVQINSSDGYEMQFQVNHLGHFLLVQNLLKSQQKRHRGEETRVVFMTSLAHYGASPSQIISSHRPRIYHPKLQYCNTKLCNLLISKEFNKRMNGEEYPLGMATAIHPGVVDTDLARTFCMTEFPSVVRPLTDRILKLLFPVCLRTVENAADLVISVLVAPRTSVAGKYIASGLLRMSSPGSHRSDIGQSLWDMSKSLCKET